MDLVKCLMALSENIIALLQGRNNIYINIMLSKVCIFESDIIKLLLASNFRNEIVM